MTTAAARAAAEVGKVKVAKAAAEVAKVKAAKAAAAEAKVKAESGAEEATAKTKEAEAVAKAARAARAAAEAAKAAAEAAKAKAATAEAKAANAGKWKCTQCGFINDCFSQYCLSCSTNKNNPYKGDYDGFNYCNKPPMQPPLPPQPPPPPRQDFVQILRGGDWSKESIYDVNSLLNDSNSESDWSDSD